MSEFVSEFVRLLLDPQVNRQVFLKDPLLLPWLAFWLAFSLYLLLWATLLSCAATLTGLDHLFCTLAASRRRQRAEDFLGTYFEAWTNP